MAKDQTHTHVVNRELPCELTDQDKAGMSEEMAKTEIAIENIKGRVTELNGEKRGLSGHLNALAHSLDEGKQERSVVCHWVEDLDQNCKRLVRQDTQEVVEEVTLTAEERQEELPN